MSEKKPTGRPTGRPQGKVDGSAEVHKRGEGLNTGKVGNVNFNERKGTSRPASGPGSNRDIPNNPLGGIGGLGNTGQTGSSHGYTHGSQGSTGHYGSSQNPLGGIGGLGGGPGSGPTQSGGPNLRPNNVTRGKGISVVKIIFIVFIVLLLMRMLGMCGTASYYTNNPTMNSNTAKPTPTPTINSSVNSASTGGTWHPISTTYENASTETVSTTVASGARDKFTTLKGNGNDTVTLLVYMCGTDLETSYGMATSDLNEMLYATASDKIKIVIETGGTKRWKNSVIASNTNQRWIIKDRTISALDKNVGKKAMTDPSTLTDFIRWGTSNYPADRYFLILWDHGGGSLAGYAHDEQYPNGTMTVDEISKALKDSGVKFDWIGFDACLMANMETAIAVEPYADYLIASEETEPGTGWYYTNWLSNLAGNTSLPTTSLGKTIIDDFVQSSYQNSSRDKTTLSMIDLAEFSGTVPSIFSEFAKEMNTTIKSDDFRQVANARSVTREFASSTYIDQIDLIHFCKNLGTASSNALAESIQSCVKYNRCNNMTNAYGLSIYFPYKRPSQVSGAVQVYENLGMDSNYTTAVRSFATLSASGQVTNNNNTNTLFDILGGGTSYPSQGSGTGYDPIDILSLLMGGGSSSNSENYYGSSYGNSYGSGYYGQGYSIYDLLGGRKGADTSGLELYSQLIGRSHVDSSNLILTENSQQERVLSLSQSEWDLIHDINLNVWVDDGEGYIDLGLDPVYSFDEDGALIVEYSGTWLGINGQVMSYYPMYSEYVSDNEYRYGYYTPILLNDMRADILFEFSNEYPEGEILGIRPVYDDGITAKGFVELEEGDKIDFLCDYYDYDGNYQNTYKLSEEVTFTGDLEIQTLQLENVKAIYGYRLTDVYDANMWTPMLEYKN